MTANSWAVFTLTIMLLMSDYMSRQLITAIFPVLKSDWALTDTQLGSLVSIVVLTVGVLTVPLSILSDAVGRAKSIAAMALLWSLATLGCGLARGYGQMFAARLIMGVGEAAYASVGVAVLIGLFPQRFRTTIIGLFLAGGSIGATLGLGLGGAIAARFGWRAAFFAMAAFGAILALVYPFVVSDRRKAGASQPGARPRRILGWRGMRALCLELASTPTLIFASLGGGLQLFVVAAFVTWTPSYLNRVYGMPMRQAAVQASVFLLAGGVGVIACSALADAAFRAKPVRKMTLAGAYCMLCAALFFGAFLAPHGVFQLSLLGAAMFFAGGAVGPTASIATDVSRVSVHATVLGVGALVNALLGSAPGPFVTGMIADKAGLATALHLVPLVGAAAGAAFWIGSRFYDRDAARIQSGL